MFCLQEMGYEVEKIAFYEISSRRTIPIQLPDENDILVFERFLETFRNYDPCKPFKPNNNKCKYCIYCNLCDKTSEDNVY